MELTLILAIIVIVIITILMFKLIKNILKAVITLTIIALVISAVLGIFIYKDARNLSNDIKHGENLFILKNNKEYMTGFVLINGNTTKAIADSDYVEKKFEKNDFDELLKDYNRVFIFDKISFDSDSEFDKLLTSGIDIVNKIQFLKKYEPESYAFMYLVSKRIKENPKFITESYKNQQIMVYPKSFIFQLLDLTLVKKEE